MLTSADLRPGQHALATLRIRDCRETDGQGNTVMTLKYLKQLCREQKLYSTPELNDKIYLHFKGFAEISEAIQAYTGLKALWLEGNGISRLERLEPLTELRCLYVQQNTLSDLDNLGALKQLATVNASNNLIKQLSPGCLAGLDELRTIQLSHNYFRSAADVAPIADCRELSVLDLSHNEIDDPELLPLLEQLPKLAVVDLRGNPVVRKIENYRRTMIARLPSLTYLDDRPVFDKERLAVEAWARGGPDAEREERQRQRDHERQEHDRHFEAMRRMQEEARARRIANHGIEQEPEFAPRLAQFRDEMLEQPTRVTR